MTGSGSSGERSDGCRVLSEHEVKIAPSTYYAAKTRPPSARAVNDEVVLGHVRRIHGSKQIGRGLYGVRKVWRHLQREQAAGLWPDLPPVPRCQVARLMRADGLRGVTRSRCPESGPDSSMMCQRIGRPPTSTMGLGSAAGSVDGGCD